MILDIDFFILLDRLRHIGGAAKVAEKTGIPVGTVRNYMQGVSSPGWEYGRAIYNYAVKELGIEAVKQCK